jgi:hypothetical protein
MKLKDLLNLNEDCLKGVKDAVSAYDNASQQGRKARDLEQGIKDAIAHAEKNKSKEPKEYEQVIKFLNGSDNKVIKDHLKQNKMVGDAFSKKPKEVPETL